MKEVKEKNLFSQNPSIAIVSEVTYAYGIIAIFKKLGGSLKLTTTPLPELDITKKLFVPTCHLEASYSKGDCIVFKSEDKKKPFIPFINIFLAIQQIPKVIIANFAGNIIPSESRGILAKKRSGDVELNHTKYEMTEFSYEKFLDTCADLYDDIITIE